MRLLIAGNTAFVLDPLVLETQSDTFLVDWVLADKKEEMEAYIETGAADRHGLSTFLFSSKKVRCHSYKLMDLLLTTNRDTGVISENYSGTCARSRNLCGPCFPSP